MKKYNIDIVDDCEVIISILSFELSKRPDYNLRTYASGEEYLAKRQADCDVLILDHYMSTIPSDTRTGIQVLKELEGMNTPIIYMSGQSDIKTAVKAMKTGANDYVSKDAENFISIVTNKVDLLIAEMKENQPVESLSSAILNGADIFAVTSMLVALLLIIYS